MINSVTSSSPYITVYGGGGGPYISPGAYNAGMVRYRNDTFEVYDGNTWLNISMQSTIGLSGEAEAAIRWASQQRAEQEQLHALMEKHPGLKAAYEQFQLMKILVTEESKNT